MSFSTLAIWFSGTNLSGLMEVKTAAFDRISKHGGTMELSFVKKIKITGF
jgi:hypothetical protein